MKKCINFFRIMGGVNLLLSFFLQAQPSFCEMAEPDYVYYYDNTLAQLEAGLVKPSSSNYCGAINNSNPANMIGPNLAYQPISIEVMDFTNDFFYSESSNSDCTGTSCPSLAIPVQGGDIQNLVNYTYCRAIPNAQSTNIYFNSFQLEDNKISSGNNGGYGYDDNYWEPSPFKSFKSGGIYNVSFGISNTTGLNYRVKLWIDFDKNGVVDIANTEMLFEYTSTNPSNSTVNGTITIPTDIDIAYEYKLLRIAVQAIQPTDVTNPRPNCINQTDFPQVEYEDYRVQFMEPLPMDFSFIEAGETQYIYHNYLVEFPEIFINQGGTLVLLNDAILEFEECAGRIVIGSGGKLILDGAILRPSYNYGCPTNTWRGINVKGNEFTAQPTPFDENSVSDVQGMLISKNGTIIENAECAIAVQNIFNITNPEEVKGGGIISVTNTNFNENAIGILFSKYTKQIQNSIITDNIFDNKGITNINFPYIGNQSFIDIIIHRNIFINDIVRNQFNFIGTGTRKGIGILNVNGNVNIGSSITMTDISADETQKNIFYKLHKGVESSDNLGVSSGVNLYGNKFDKVKKAITINSALNCEIIDNTILLDKIGNDPISTNSAGLPIVADSYGIYTIGCQGALVAGNYLSNQNAQYMFPGIITNSAEPTATSSILDNDFLGSFRTANSFELNNPNVRVRCNDYYHDNDRDWGVFGTSDTPGFLVSQGTCGDDNNPLDPLLENWQELCTTPNDMHIFLNSFSSSLTVTPLTDYPIPTCNSASVTVAAYCDLPLGYENECSWRIRKLRSAIEGQLSEATTSEEKDQAITELSKSYTLDNDIEGAISRLNTIDDTEAKKILIPTYIDMENYELASYELSLIPLDNADNLDYYNIYSAYLEAELAGTGKNDIAEATLLAASSNMESSYSGIGETYRITKEWKLGERIPMDQDLKSIEHIVEHSEFQIVPNPASTNFAILPIEPLNFPIEFFIYDIQGKCLQNHKLNSVSESIDITLLENGYYLAKIVDAYGQSMISNLVIFK